MVTTKENAVAGNAGRIWGSAYIFLRITNGRVDKPVSDIKRTSPETRVGSGFHQDDVYRRYRFEVPSRVLLVDDEQQFVQTLSERLQLRNMGTLGGNVALDTRCQWINQTYFWRSALGFCLSTLVRNGNATAVIMVVLGLFFYLLATLNWI